MKPEAKQIIKDALQEHGELPLTWECGCDSSLLNFGGWANNWKDLGSAFQSGLRELDEHIIYQLELPRAGGLMDKSSSFLGGGTAG